MVQPIVRLGFCTYQNAPLAKRVRRSSLIRRNVCFAEAKQEKSRKQLQNFRHENVLVLDPALTSCISGSMTAADLTCSSYGGLVLLTHTHTHITNRNSRDNRPSTYPERATCALTMRQAWAQAYDGDRGRVCLQRANAPGMYSSGRRRAWAVWQTCAQASGVRRRAWVGWRAQKPRFVAR